MVAIKNNLLAFEFLTLVALGSFEPSFLLLYLQLLQRASFFAGSLSEQR
jgi:hypothetical protein